jgi:hypothetical protein
MCIVVAIVVRVVHKVAWLVLSGAGQSAGRADRHEVRWGLRRRLDRWLPAS